MSDSEHEDAAFDKIMELVGNDGKFQKIFNYFFNIALVCFASMSFMNIIMVLNEPGHTCRLPEREKYNISLEAWQNLTIPYEEDNRGLFSLSGCKMYNISAVENLPIDQWNFTKDDTITCVNGYEYDKTWYERTVVSDEDWICEDTLYQTNVFVFHRIGEVVGTFFFGQLGDTIGRRPVFYISAVVIIVGRIMTIFTPSIYYLFAAASMISMLTSMSIFLSPLIIAMETSKGEDRAKIAMLQCVGWTMGLSIMPFVFQFSRNWIYFLLLTTFPVGIFALWPKYMIESPRWLATKRYLDRCAVELNRIAKINGKDIVITEKLLDEMLPRTKVEQVFGIASLFTGWRLTKNTILSIICWTTVSLTYFVLFINSTRMGGNPFASFFYQSIIELPAYIIGKMLGDIIGRRFTNAFSFLSMSLFSIPAFLLARTEHDVAMRIVVVCIKFCSSITFFAVNLQSMEIYPTCLRQSGLAVGSIVANIFASLGPYIIFLGTEIDVRYPYLVIGLICFIGFSAAMFLPETLHHQLPNTLYEAQKFGKHQKFWTLPKAPKPITEEEMKSLETLTRKLSAQNGNSKAYE